MDASGQTNFTPGSEVVPSSGCRASNVGMEDVGLVHGSGLQAFPQLRPLIVRLPGTSPGFQEEMICQAHSPKDFLHTSRLQQPLASLSEASNYSRYEDIAGLLGERLASGSISDVPILTASERLQVCSSGRRLRVDNSAPKLKFMCSFGGRILPRPFDGKLRYVGGDTRIVSVSRHTDYSSLVHKLRQIFGQDVILKYQLPNEDLDALISILSDEDVENMVEEYDKLETCEPLSRLRIFLFSPGDHNAYSMSFLGDPRNTDQLYVDTVNGTPVSCPMKHIDVVTVSCSNKIAGVEVSDSWSGSQFVNNVSVSLPISQVPQMNLECIKPSANEQALLRNAANAAVPSSPTIALHLAQAKQGPFSDIPFHIYPDQSFTAPFSNFQEVERVGSLSSSLSSQHDWAVESKRVTDPSTITQHESSFEQFCGLEQRPGADLQQRMLKLRSYGGLMPIMQQHVEGKPLSIVREKRLENRLPDISHSQMGHILQQEMPVSQDNWQQTSDFTRDGHQGLGSSQVVALENAQAHLQVHRQPQYHLPGVTYVKPLEQHYELTYPYISWQPNIKAGMALVAPAMHPGSAPQSPRLVSHESKSVQVQNIDPQYISGQKSYIGSHIDHICARATGHDEENSSHLHADLQAGQEQTLNVIEGPIWQYSPVASSRIDVVPQANMVFIKCEGEPLRSCFPESVVPPYPVARFHQDQTTILGERGLLRSDEDSTYLYGELNAPQYQGAVDWTAKQGHYENIMHVWTQTDQTDRDEKPSMDACPSRSMGNKFIQMDVPCVQMFEASLVTSAANLVNTIEQLDSGCDVGLQTHFSSQMESQMLDLLSPSLREEVLTVTKLDENVQTAHALPSFSCNRVLNDPMVTTNFVEASQNNANATLDCGMNMQTSVPKSGMIASMVPAADAMGKVVSCSLVNYDKHAPNMHPTVSTSTSPPCGSLNSLGLKAVPSEFSCSGISDLSAVGGLFMGPSIPSIFDNSTASSTVNAAAGDSMNMAFNMLSENTGMAYKKGDLISLERAGLNNSCNPMPLTSLQVLNSLEDEGDYPKFDPDTFECTENSVHNYDDPEHAVTDLNAPVICTAPTLSLQNWEESLAKVGFEEIPVDTGKDVLDEGLPVALKDIQELKISVDDENTESKQGLAVRAEEEAIARGLQTIKNSDLEELRELGSGTFGTVFYGKWRGTDVAIKRIKSSCFTGRSSEKERLLCDFWREALILGQLHHPNVVAFYGVVPDGPGGTLATVTEYMVNGSLKQVLQKKDRTIDRRKRLLIIMDAAFGMEYLHGKNIVHFDLKCENLLVNMKDTQRPICKVGDLGLSKVKHQTMVSGGVRGTLPWMAPELLNGSDNLVSEKVDVFSFGIVMWELLTGEEPYANMHYGAIIGGIVNNTLRPPVPSWCDPAWKCLMERCWAADPRDRPAFLEIAAELRSMTNAKSQGQG